MKILITGVSGFLGSWAVHMFSELGHDIHGISSVSQRDFLWQKSLSRHKVSTFSEADIADFSKVDSMVKNLAPDLVIHLAATSTLYESQKNPELAFKNNVLATASIMQACVSNSVPRMIVSTTDKVYNPALAELGRPFTEESRLMGSEAYSISKVGTEKLIETMSNMVVSTAETMFTVVRMGNIIGGGDRGPLRLSTSIANSIASGHPVIVRSPESTRPWQSVFDALAGLLVSALSQSKSYEAWNVAPQDEPLTVKEILTRLGEKIPGWTVGDSTGEIIETKELSISSEKLFSMTGFETLVEPVDAFESLALWERLAQTSSPTDVTLLCEQQVKDYLHEFSFRYPSLFSLIRDEAQH